MFTKMWELKIPNTKNTEHYGFGIGQMPTKPTKYHPQLESKHLEADCIQSNDRWFHYFQTRLKADSIEIKSSFIGVENSKNHKSNWKWWPIQLKVRYLDLKN